MNSTVYREAKHKCVGKCHFSLGYLLEANDSSFSITREVAYEYIVRANMQPTRKVVSTNFTCLGLKLLTPSIILSLVAEASLDAVPLDSKGNIQTNVN